MMLKKPFDLAQQAPHQSTLVEDLNDRAFGPGRFAKTAYRLREGRAPIDGLSFVATDGDVFCGSVRYWRVKVGGTAALLLGPLAVEPARQGQGIGCALIMASLEHARAMDEKLVFLVGDPPYYARTGFLPVPMGRIALPGPVDYARLLARELAPGALEGVSGAMTAG